MIYLIIFITFITFIIFKYQQELYNFIINILKIQCMESFFKYLGLSDKTKETSTVLISEMSICNKSFDKINIKINTKQNKYQTLISFCIFLYFTFIGIIKIINQKTNASPIKIEESFFSFWMPTLCLFWLLCCGLPLFYFLIRLVYQTFFCWKTFFNFIVFKIKIKFKTIFKNKDNKSMNENKNNMFTVMLMDLSLNNNFIISTDSLWEINMTFLIFILPFISLLILFFIWTLSKKIVYEISLFLSSINFVICFFLIFLFDGTKSGFQFPCILDLMPSVLYSLHLGIDGISIFFLLLTYFFIYLCILSLNTETPRIKEAIAHLFFLQWTVTASFLFVDLLGFFLFFEMTLIPIYFLVLGWGSRERKVRASYLISLYTMFGSIFLFFNILYFYSKTGTTNYELLLTFELNKEDQLFLWIFFFLSFAAKIPVFPLHIWLPEAHVEAPTLGSVLLAVLLLKLGTYGLIRFSIPLLYEGTLYHSGWVILFAIISIIYTCLTAIRQIDLKKIIAYSSVGHMNVVLLGIISESSEGLQGGIFQMLSHGIVSGALFFAVGALYERYTVRSLKYFGGLTYLFPLLSIIFLIFFLANISFPLTSSFIGEFLIFMGFFKQSFWGTFFASTSMVLGAVYTLWTYNRIFFGNIKILSITSFKDLTKKEAGLFGILIFFLFLMGICPNIFLDIFLVDVLNVLDHSKRISVLN